MIPAAVLVGLTVAGAALGPLVRAAPQNAGVYTNVVKSPFQGAGAYGLAFVAPASYGYAADGPYNANTAASFGFQGPAADGLGPGKYAFPIFDHNQGYGGFGALGYYGTNLGFAYPGYGYGNGMFGARAYGNPFI